MKTNFHHKTSLIRFSFASRTAVLVSAHHKMADGVTVGSFAAGCDPIYVLPNLYLLLLRHSRFRS